MPEFASVAVVIASRGRPDELDDMLSALRAQRELPVQVVLSITQAGDLHEQAAACADLKVDVVMGEAGLCAQRNRGLDAVDQDVDVIAFWDDDYVPRLDAILNVSRLYSEHPDVVAANGVLIADGINGPGISLNEAKRMLEESVFEKASDYKLEPMTALYGCNMTVRRSAIGPVRFDENLPLYGWQEDIDFTAQIARKGLLVKCTSIVGIHRGVKGGRVSGLRFGYSQIINPAYLVRKGTMSRSYAVKIALRNLAANLLKLLRPEPWVDRRGRLWGNALGVLDLLRGAPDTAEDCGALELGGC